ncbi:hypothetical protein SDC9_57253 [bioreactor metagenome]|uniref:Uncharacterized protein n=1 Tax=bioreactor metagenome TaxID=1076179 RepID=A0A644X437_9ZZZZ
MHLYQVINAGFQHRTIFSIEYYKDKRRKCHEFPDDQERKKILRDGDHDHGKTQPQIGKEMK